MHARFLLTALIVFLTLFSNPTLAQIYQPEGLNIPGEWNGWTNPPAAGPFLSSSQSGGLVNLITYGQRRWSTTYQSNFTGSRQFLFTSGPNASPYNNKWGGTSFSLNSIQSVFYQSASNNSVGLVNGRYYTINWSDIGYQNTSACIMETSSAPVTISSTAQNPAINAVYPGNSVAVTASLSASPSTEEKFFLRYSLDGWLSSSVVLMTVSGNSASANIPGQGAGTLVSYYVFSTTLSLTSGQSNLTYDLATIRRNNYSNGQNESYTVQNCPTPTFTTVPSSTSCFGQSVEYQTQSGMSNYSWSFPGTLGTDYTISTGGNSTSSSVTIVWLTQGSKTVTVNYLNTLGCTSNTAASNTISIQAIDFANIQFPQSSTICQGSSSDFYGQFYEPGLTDIAVQSSGPSGVIVQFGISSNNTNPATWPAGSWQSTQFNFNGSGGNNDEFMITTGSSLSPGTYYYAFRYSLNGCGYQYGGWSGSNGGFWNGSSNVNGIFTINPSSNYYADTDGDGYGAGAATNACSQPAGYVTSNTDCNNSNSAIYPGATEVCNGADDDCDGSTDEGVQTTYYVDADGDGYGSSSTTALGCTAPTGYVSNSTDCDDTTNGINPGATEVCDGVDQDCDGTADEGLTFTNYYVDGDGDGFGSTTSDSFCENPGVGYATNNNDCNDTNAQINPSANEFCNSADDNCNTQIDEDLNFINYFVDADSDGFGAGAPQSFCSNPGASYAANNTDCNNSNANVYPGATETCNGNDDDCDGNADEGSLTTYYLDNDGDGFGGSNSIAACTALAGYITTGGDCFDFGASVNPNATELCGNSIDDNCDGTIDNATLNYFADSDGDGFAGGASVAIQSCTAPAGYYTTSTDCNNSNNTIYPGAIELCNNVDDDCDTQIDEGVQSVFYADADGDGFGGSSTQLACTQPAGYTNSSTDCNDSNANENPAATEACNNVDDDCDGLTDEGCPTTIPGEEPSNAISAPSSYYSYCSNFFGTLSGAYPSASALSTCITGEDKWYSFLALTPAVTISVSSTVNDILIELQNFNGQLIDVENAVSGIGNEVMNMTGLTPGTLYRVGIRNYNSGIAAGGSFTGCIRHLKAGNCDSGNSTTWPGTLNRCNTFKASWPASGVQFRFTFTGISGTATGNVYTRTQSSDYLNLNNLTPSIPSGCQYNVLVTNIYTLTNGAGITELVEVAQANPTTITITSDPLTQLRASDRCSSGPRFRNAIVASLPWVCGVSNWRWRFTEVDNNLQPVGLTFELNRGAASNYLNLATVSQIQYGKTYAVQTAPIFTYTGTNYLWGPVQYMCIIGQAGMVLQNEEFEGSENKDLFIANEPQLNVYPNPSKGEIIHVAVTGIETQNATLTVYNSLGILVLQTKYAINENGQMQIEDARNFANGLYVIEFETAGERLKSRILIER